MSKPCAVCGSDKHTKTFCFQAKRTPVKKIGRRGMEYRAWRDEVAIPHLDATYGRVCSVAGCNIARVDVDHIKKRGSHPHLVMSLDNVRYLCRRHHIDIT